MNRLHATVRVVLVGICCAASAEATCRIDDWLRYGASVFDSPNRDSALKVNIDGVTIGRPFGLYKKWRLNNLGLRGPDVEITPPHGRTRVLILGASEAFGLYESADTEFPRQLERCLKNVGDVEVLNCAITGMTARSMLPYWQRWGFQFDAHFVVIYANPLFYLNNISAPATESEPDLPDAIPLTSYFADPAQQFQFRILLQAKEAFEFPEYIQRWRRQRTVEAIQKGQPPGWAFDAAPQERLCPFRKRA